MSSTAVIDAAVNNGFKIPVVGRVDYWRKLKPFHPRLRGILRRNLTNDGSNDKLAQKRAFMFGNSFGLVYDGDVPINVEKGGAALLALSD